LSQSALALALTHRGAGVSQTATNTLYLCYRFRHSYHWPHVSAAKGDVLAAAAAATSDKAC